MSAMADLAILLLFPMLMIFAAFSDLFTMTISNRVSLALVAIFFALAFALRLPYAEIGWHAACGTAVLACTFVLFSFGWIGGGDAKLAAATALWVGFDHLVDYGLFASLFGGMLTIFILLLRRWPLPTWTAPAPWLSRLHDKTSGVPYGIALALAGLLVYPDTGLWLGAAGA